MSINPTIEKMKHQFDASYIDENVTYEVTLEDIDKIFSIFYRAYGSRAEDLYQFDKINLEKKDASYFVMDYWFYMISDYVQNDCWEMQRPSDYADQYIIDNPNFPPTLGEFINYVTSRFFGKTPTKF